MYVSLYAGMTCYTASVGSGLGSLGARKASLLQDYSFLVRELASRASGTSPVVEVAARRLSFLWCLAGPTAVGCEAPDHLLPLAVHGAELLTCDMRGCHRWGGGKAWNTNPWATDGQEAASVGAKEQAA